MAAKVRPCLVLSIPPLDQDRALVTVIPHTTAARGSRFEVQCMVKFLRPGDFDAQNIITIPNVKLMKRLGLLPSKDFSDATRQVCLWLGFQGESEKSVR
ncbi:MAG: type II toxin-antitoxin system PemK/MazF family toxin [Desulfovermiculus sp.]